MPGAVSTPLGDYLRARRAAADPRRAGLVHGQRRVPGLRREEVSMLAGVSNDYYARLEQGREWRPSAEIVTALAAALALGPDETDHLRRLADLPATEPRATAEVGAEVMRLLEQWADQPAFAMTDAMDILAANELGERLHRSFAVTDNLAKMVFLYPEGRRFYVEWDDVAELTTANLRAAWGVHRGTGEVGRLVDELSAGSPAFAELWARQHVATKTSHAKLLDHPDVGRITLQFHTLTVPGPTGRHVVVYSAEPGSSDERALKLLRASAQSASLEA